MNFSRPLLLGSGSPRRQFLMREAGFTFTVEISDVDEVWPKELPVTQVARYLAARKAEAFRPNLKNEVVVTADTVVILENKIMNKPQDRAEAVGMLKHLSGKTHTVITGVCILSAEKEVVFDDTTRVTFAPLSDEEIAYYIDTHKPYDKAGAYGAQDFIGMIGIHHIEGSYFNVMGLPIHKVYQQLKDWL